MFEILCYFNYFKFLFGYINQNGAKNIMILVRVFHRDFNVEGFSVSIAADGICMGQIQVSIVKFKIFA